MRSYSETEVFSKAARKLLSRARDLVKGLPDPAEGSEPLRCHEVARVVAQKLAGQVCGLGALVLDVVDGKFGEIEHSWIEVADPEGPRRLILDVYAVGSLPQVQLHDATGLLPHLRTYTRGAVRVDIREAVIQELSLMKKAKSKKACNVEGCDCCVFERAS